MTLDDHLAVIETRSIDLLCRLNEAIPEFPVPYTTRDIADRLDGLDWYALVAEQAGQPIGFKIGYFLEDGAFYSWLGGVVPAGRGSGAARAMLQRQERYVVGRGCREIRVKSRNRFSGMVQLLLSSGYLITGFEAAEDPVDNRLWFTRRF